MFTGIIKHIGTIESMNRSGDDIRLTVKVKDIPQSAEIGASVSNSGVCLTVVEKTNNTISYDVMAQTIKLTSLGSKQIGDSLNVEASMQVGGEVGGHFVYGHVDGVAEVSGIREEGDSVIMTIKPPDHLMKYIAPQGSVSIEGVSLTVSEQRENDFDVSLIEHTMEETNFSELKVGSKVNIEVDMMMKYLERLLESRELHE
jgi:riboflavin synthase